MKRSFLKTVSLVMAMCLLLGASFAAAEGCGLGTGVTDVNPANDAGRAAPASSTIPVAAPSNTGNTVLAANSNGDSEKAVVLAAAKELVTRTYKATLNREPDETGLQQWSAALADGTLSAADLVMGIVDSDEYKNSGKSNEQIVTDLYQAMLGRKPESDGLEAWKQLLDVGMSSRRVAAGLVGSQEFNALAAKYGIRTGEINFLEARDANYELTYFVYRLYANCLGRKPDIAGLEGWCRALLQGGKGAEAAYGFIFSTEYLSRHVTNGTYVSMLYDTLLGRKIDGAGYQAWTNVLDFTNTREKVLNGFLFSTEFINQCNRAGILIGNPVEELDDTAAWQNNVAVLNLANYYRSLYGTVPLRLREDLWHDVAMARTNEITTLFEHTRPDGRSCFTAWDDVGLTYWYAGENIAYGYSSPESVMTAWMNSTGHRRNLLDPNFENMSTGYIRKNNTTYWSQNFMTE